jgi:hypothetical protein
MANSVSLPQWELKKNKRPPYLGCWQIESIGSSDRNDDLAPEDRSDGWGLMNSGDSIVQKRNNESSERSRSSR